MVNIAVVWGWSISTPAPVISLTQVQKRGFWESDFLWPPSKTASAPYCYIKSPGSIFSSPAFSSIQISGCTVHGLLLPPFMDWTSSVVTEPESHPRHSPTGSYLVFLVSFHQLDRKSDWGRSTIDWGIAAIEVARGLPGSIFLIVTQCRTQSTVGGIISALVDLGCKLKITEQANLSASSLPGFCFSSYLCVPAWVPTLNDEHARMDM